MPKASLYKNMQAHLRFHVSLEFLQQFDDIEKRLEMRQQEARERIFGLRKAQETTQKDNKVSKMDKDFYSNLKANTR